ncbi:MAG: hypothetical protein V3T26_05910 [candidate division NC10 bacterium]
MTPDELAKIRVRAFDGLVPTPSVILEIICALEASHERERALAAALVAMLDEYFWEGPIRDPEGRAPQCAAFVALHAYEEARDE